MTTAIYVFLFIKKITQLTANLVRQIPHEMMLQSRNSYVAADAQPLPLHGLGLNMKGEPVDYRAYLEDNIQAVLREAIAKSKGWHSAPGPENIELTYKKVQLSDSAAC